ncbi:hypothetical protein LJR153_005192 [Paenibacillus sp. LjRoot153]|uniref:hypothetical protein n=1 Tax=Paenibacillus sp. LjRoot153 TaxID=3342270 RepID=UPI003ECC4E1B
MLKKMTRVRESRVVKKVIALVMIAMLQKMLTILSYAKLRATSGELRNMNAAEIAKIQFVSDYINM